MKKKPRISFFIMDNKVQNYNWGSIDSLNKLFGIKNPNSGPQAEMWMGSHYNGCSKIKHNGNKILLSEFITENKNSVLSTETAKKFGDLPYLFKVLAARQALSIQVHPNKYEAELGFEKENLAGIAHHAPERNYKDPNHKPELVYALTPYQAMNGFRSVSDIIRNFSTLNIEQLRPITKLLLDEPNELGLRSFFCQLLSMEGEEKYKAITTLLEHAQEHCDNKIYALILELNKQYPKDIGLFSPLILNVLTLQPGEAMFLEARTPHAYLQGTALEIMANSDNVLRAGLTSKHIDVIELAKCTSFVEKTKSSLLLEPIKKEDTLLFPVPVTDFKFAIFIKPNNTHVSVNSAEILMALDSKTTLTNNTGEAVTIGKGQSVFIPAYAKNYQVCSLGRVARVYN